MAFNWLKFLFLIALFMGSPNLFCGELEEFEENATGDSEENDDENSGSSAEEEYNDVDDDSESSSFGEAMAEIFFRIIGHFFVTGGKYSFARMGALSDSTVLDMDYPVKPRNVGDYLLPFFQADLSGGVVNRDIASIKFYLESGYGPLGAQASHVFLFENKTKDKLFLNSVSGLWRMSFGNYFVLGFGMGASQLVGRRESLGLNFTFPAKISFPNNWIIYYRPIFSFFENGSASEYNFGFGYSFSRTSISLGYQSYMAGSSELRGIQLGYFIHY